MVRLLEPVSVAGMELRNRIMRSATAERLSEPDGTPLPELADMMGTLARGGVGLIVLGHTFLRPDGKASRGMAGLWRDDQIPAFARIAQAVHAEGGRIAVQINHSGRQGRPEILGQQPLAPSALPESEWTPVARGLDADEIPGLIDAYAQAARRVKEAGFDAVQIHAAHGYLIGQFLSPHANRRDDEWGGSLENRARFFREVVRAVREQVGPGYPVLTKLGLADFIEGGMPLEDGLAVVGMLEEMGLDLVEISGGAGAGNSRERIRHPEDEAYFLPWARRARPLTKLPVALVGGFRSAAVMQRVLDEGAADLISLSRPLIREPDLPLKLARGESVKATCISCNLCSKNNQEPTRCWVD
ncbi:MAG: NADH:flavin oxidoreductase [Anaerolineae bacterium]|jgi:2,4-dienoyl-CoA reductase-like NADH-dependent reductase (Old Yellow Enzyme family)